MVKREQQLVVQLSGGVIYDWGWNSDNTKKGHRILIDKREFPKWVYFY